MRFFCISLFATLLSVSVIAQKNDSSKLGVHKNTDRSIDTLLLAFEDNFDGNKVDERKWRVINGVVRDRLGEHEKQWYSPNNVEVSDGTLKLIAKREELKDMRYEFWVTDRMVPFTDSFNFSSGEIDSREQFGFGVYEIRCKIPKGKGFWPAFWMYGEKEGVNNELDVFEFWNQRGVFTKLAKNKLSKQHNMTAHYNRRMSQRSYIGPDFSQDFHTFRLVWDECRIEWWVDDIFRRRITRYKSMNAWETDCSGVKDRSAKNENVFPRDSVMHIIVNLALQAKDAAPDQSTIFPDTLEVDYIRYYKWTN